MGWRVTALHVDTGQDGVDRITSVEARTPKGDIVTLKGDYFYSTMPVRELLRSIQAPIPAEVKAISDGLQYRDFITVGLLVDRLLITEPDGSRIKDTWIYIQEPDVLVGRMQIFNNWSPYLVSDPDKVWIGLEYFCYDTDPLWKKSDRGPLQVRDRRSGPHRHSQSRRSSRFVRVPRSQDLSRLLRNL